MFSAFQLLKIAKSHCHSQQNKYGHEHEDFIQLLPEW